MTDKRKKRLTDAEIKARSLSRWENEGGAPADETGIEQPAARDDALTPQQRAEIARVAAEARRKKP